ncbi:glutathione S-transferase family protein [Sessilibacter corallicola]|uniref:glutathione S-transferase family protein n=1 Tax=Sessilibacter corallicola TaxID=2904075 RepID=UPI001E35B2BE|nr:glutathione S-transferase family protein [Sessilibacter corallicola]MCE2030172.1 glutathione S-transferase family protein [Sessilibacter corallicola]
MKLVGTLLSHFVRRVAIPMQIYGIDYELVEASVVNDQDLIRNHNKLVRIPSLVLDDGDILADSNFILDELDLMVPDDVRLTPSKQENRRSYGQVIASLTGSMDKATAWFYEARRRPENLVWPEWAEHLSTQLAGGLIQVEEMAAENPSHSPYLFEDKITHADIAVGLVYPMANLVTPGLVNENTCPRMHALSKHMNATEAFMSTIPSK